jgi:3-oxoacyl-[acyl-carrier-protein] synthase II
MRRVVVTGLGILSPLGVGVNHNWKRLINSESGISQITRFDATDLAAKIAGSIPLAQSLDQATPENGLFHPDMALDPKDQKKVDDLMRQFLILVGCLKMMNKRAEQV